MSAEKRKRKPVAGNANCSRASGSAPIWEDGFLVSRNGTTYCVQRENFYAAQRTRGGWQYYLLRQKPNERRFYVVPETNRSRDSAVRRREIAREWAHRSNAVQAEARLLRKPDFETQRRRALFDRKGTVVKEGVSWVDGRETHWLVRHSLHGKTNQLDLLANGVLVRTCGARRLPRRFRP